MKKHYIFIAMIIIGFIFPSCKKSNQTPARLLVGTWSLVSDSTYYSGTPLIKGGSSTYVGTANDHYTFTSTQLYVSGDTNSKFDTASYSTAHDSIKFSNYKNPEITGEVYNSSYAGYAIAKLDSHNFTLTQYYTTPAGIYSQDIVLKR